MKEVLFIAYQIPPIAGPAAQRHIRFLKRLPSLGWKPTVLSVDPECCEDYYIKDQSLVRHLDPKMSIHRTMSYNPIEHALSWRNAFNNKQKMIVSSDTLTLHKSRKQV